MRVVTWFEEQCWLMVMPVNQVVWLDVERRLAAKWLGS